MPKTKTSDKSVAKPHVRKWTHHLDVVGLKFRWTRDGRQAISRMIDKKGSITGITLEREPDNKWDDNAIKVMLPSRVIDGKQLGYLRAPAAELLAPKLDDGSLIVVSAKLTSLDADEDWNEGTLEVIFGDVKTAKR